MTLTLTGNKGERLQTWSLNNSVLDRPSAGFILLAEITAAIDEYQAASDEGYDPPIDPPIKENPYKHHG